MQFCAIGANSELTPHVSAANETLNCGSATPHILSFAHIVLRRNRQKYDILLCMSIEDRITSDVEAREQLRQVMQAVQERVCARYQQATARIHAERRHAIFTRLEMLRKAK